MTMLMQPLVYVPLTVFQLLVGMYPVSIGTLNIGPSGYKCIIRLNEAKRRLSIGEMNVNEIADECGFASSSYFITSFRKFFGVTPCDYLKK